MRKITSIQREAWIGKIALGTVQFGLEYGVSNKLGQVSESRVYAILDVASKSGISLLDTAAVYGDSEKIVGKAVAAKRYGFDIVSKFQPTAFSVRNSLTKSLKSLRKSGIKAYLAHSFDSFLDLEIRRQLVSAKEEGLIDQIGVSVYYPRQIEELFEAQIDFDLVQMPFNVFDQRFKPLFDRLRDKSVEVHTRSVFLQGLFFLQERDLEQKCRAAAEPVSKIKRLCRDHGIPLSALLLNYAVMQPQIDKVVIGVTSPAELQENLDSFAYFDKCEALLSKLEGFSILDEEVILPFNWQQ